MLDFHMFEDAQMEAWRGRMEGRESTYESVGENAVIRLDYDQVLDLLGVTEAFFKTKSKAKREQILSLRGLKVVNIIGRASDAKFIVALGDEFIFNIMLRRYENQRVRKMPEYQLDYMRMLMDGNGLITQGGAKLAPLLSDVAEVLAERHGMNEQKMFESIKSMRVTLAKLKYIAKEKTELIRHEDEAIEYAGEYANMFKTHRAFRGGRWVYENGEKKRIHGTPIKGMEAVTMSRKIGKLYQQKYIALEEALPLAGLTGKAREMRRDERKAISYKFPQEICEELELSSIKTVYANTASMKAMVDYHAILELFMLGATFSEVKEFMAERVGFWEEYDKDCRRKRDEEMLGKPKVSPERHAQDGAEVETTETAAEPVDEAIREATESVLDMFDRRKAEDKEELK